MHYQIFVPRDPDADPMTHPLDRAGLSDLIDNAEGVPIGNGQGPDDKPGDCYAWRRPGQMQMGIRQEGQTWIPAMPIGGEKAARYWVGIWNDSPPIPFDLERQGGHPGKWVKLGDGQEWCVPSYWSLPQEVRRLPSGEWTADIRKDFEGLARLGLQLCRMTKTESPQPLDFFTAADSCETILRVNYRLLPEVVSHLELFTTDNLADVISAFTGEELSRHGTGKQ